MNIEAILRNAFHLIRPPGPPFAAETFTVFSLDEDLTPQVVTQHPDLYGALLGIRVWCAAATVPEAAFPLMNARGLGVLATGWATPLTTCETTSDDDGRRRARIAVLVTENLATGTLITFENSPEELIFDRSEAHGELINAVVETMRSIVEVRQSLL